MSKKPSKSEKSSSNYDGDFPIYKCLKCQHLWTKKDLEKCPKCNTKFWNTVNMVTQIDFDKFRQTEVD
jgi:hypothetical protein